MVGNYAYFCGGGLCSEYSIYSSVINNTFTLNTASMGGGIGVFTTDLLSKNNILWADSANNVNEVYGLSIQMEYSNIQDTLWPGEGNMSVDPLFRDPENGDFHLMSTACGDSLDSPSIDAGDPSIFDYLLDCQWGLGDERSDMGAYGGMAIPTGIKELEFEPMIPRGLCLSQNYPNPFNCSTVIEYSLPDESYVTITIYNVLGQMEETIFDGLQQAGHQTITWNADDYPSGVYFARVKAGERTGNIRMVLIK